MTGKKIHLYLYLAVICTCQFASLRRYVFKKVRTTNILLHAYLLSVYAYLMFLAYNRPSSSTEKEKQTKTDIALLLERSGGHYQIEKSKAPSTYCWVSFHSLNTLRIYPLVNICASDSSHRQQPRTLRFGQST